jgi:large subunit ribosomal protein L17
MRHRKKIHLLARPADQRKAMLRSMATSLFEHGRITTTLQRAKALKELADKIVTLAKRGDVHAMRQTLKFIYNKPLYELIPDGDSDRLMELTILRKIFRFVGPACANRVGGYTRVTKAPPRRGDASPMAVIEIIDHPDLVTDATAPVAKADKEVKAIA